MDKLLCYDSIMESINKIKNRNMLSNSIFSAQELSFMFMDGMTSFYNYENTLIIDRKVDDFNRLYFYTKNLSTMTDVIDFIKNYNGDIVIDVIGKRGSAVDLISSFFDKHGITEYTTFIRMICKNINKDSEIIYNNVDFATLKDLDDINSMLHKTFDKYSAHFPSLDTIAERIVNKEVFVVRGDNCIKGFSIYNSINKINALFDYCIVDDRFRRMRIANDLFNYKLKYANNSRYYYLWVDEHSIDTIKWHHQNGFQEDGIVDKIIVIKA